MNLLQIHKNRALHHFSLADQDEMQLNRIRAVKRLWGNFRENLDKTARNLGTTNRAVIPNLCLVLARGYYAILEDAGYNGTLEEPAF